MEDLPDTEHRLYTKQDIEYFQKKLELEPDPVLQTKIKKQIELLEDGAVIYGEERTRWKMKHEEK